MSVIAGIVCLKPSEFLTAKNLEPMLEAMRPWVSSRLATYTMANGGAVIGKVVYGPDADDEENGGGVIETPRVFCVGEIYNDEVLQSGSAEQFLLERYLDRGVRDFATGLNGSFSAVVSDPRDGSVTLLTDHIDSIPFYTTVYNDKLYFASEVKALTALDELPCEVDVSSVLSLATRGFFVNRRSLVQDVRQMDYASLCRIHSGQIETWAYWRYEIESAPDKGQKHYVDEFSHLLRRAVERRAAGPHTAIMLSGGVDSRGILCCLEDPSRISAVTFTAKTRRQRHKLGDWALAEIITKRLGMDLSIIHYDSGNFARAMQESVYASDAASGFVYEDIWKNIRQATGAEYLLMGDECLGWANGSISDEQVLPTIGIHALQNVNGVQGCMRRDLLDSFIELSLKDIESIWSSCELDSACDRVDQLYFDQRLIHFLAPKRRIPVRHGMFVRNPWLDLDILDFVRRLPIRYRIGKSLFCKTLKHIDASLCSLPRARASEIVDYQSYISKVEREDKSISRMVMEDNDLFEEFFDVRSVTDLIESICSEKVCGRRFDPITLLPMSVRLKLGSYVSRFRKPGPRFSAMDVFLRIAMVATALRYVSKRFKNKPYS